MDWVAAQSRHYEVTVIAGDLLNMFSPDMGEQIPAVRAWLRTFPGPLVVCSGNHDYFPAGPHTRASGAGRWLRTLMRKPSPIEAVEEPFAEVVAREGVWADGARFSLGGLRWEVSGWSAARAATTGAEVDMLVVHAPPAGTAVSMEDQRDLGDDEVRLAVLRHGPRLVLSGHVHARNDWYSRLGDSICLNPGYAMSPNCAPAHIVIDTIACTATWRALALAAEETIPLEGFV